MKQKKDKREPEFGRWGGVGGGGATGYKIMLHVKRMKGKQQQNGYIIYIYIYM